MPRPAVTEPPAYEEGGNEICINVCKRERDTDSVCTEKNAATQDHSYTAWEGRENACLQDKEAENATKNNYTHSLILVLHQKARNKSHIHTWAVDVHMNGLPGVLGLQKEQLCHYQTGVFISDLYTHK